MDDSLLAEVGLRLTADGPVATITLDRPEIRNAQTPPMWKALAEIGRGLTEDVRVVVLRGAGQSFSSGLDRRLLDPAKADADDGLLWVLRLGDQEMADAIAAFQEGFTFLRDPRFVSIAVVQGHAIGAGFQLALACDLRLLADDAVLSMREAALGLVPDLSGTKPLVEAVGYAKALELCATARNVDAAEAQAIGLANTVAPATELDDRLAELVAALTAPLPGAVREIKGLLLGASARSLEDQCRAEREAQVRRFRELAAMVAAR